MNVFLWLATGALVALVSSFDCVLLSRQRLLISATVSGLGALIAGAATLPSDQWLSLDVDWRGIAAAGGGAVLLLTISRLHARRGC